MSKLVMGGGLLCVLSLLAFGIAIEATAANPIAAGSDQEPLPASLAAWYPPQQEMPLFYLHMHDLEMAQAAVINDVLQGDIANAKAGFERFAAAYHKIGEMVPEWKHYLDTGALEAMKAAMAGGDQGAFMGSLERMGKSCEECHHANMPRVAMNYRWPRVERTPITDPVTGQSLKFKQFKQMMSLSFTGIATDLSQGQMENALKNYDAFAARFGKLEGSCTDCHTTDRRYYVDEEMAAVVEELGTVLKSGTGTPDQVKGLMMQIGQETCAKCHMVHVPATYAPYYAK